MIAPFSRRFRHVFCAAACAALAACGQSQPERQFVADADAAVTGQFVAGQTLSAPIVAQKSDAPDFAVLTLPVAAGRGRLSEKQYVNGWRQSVSLDRGKVAGDWNDLSIDIIDEAPSDNPSGVAPGMFRISKPTRESVRREILARFHGTPMRIVERPMRNALGPYGLAVGAAPDDARCAFAWQWVDNLAAAARGEKSNFFNSGVMPASIRLRLCRRGVTADQLAEWYERLEIVDPANVARIAEAMRRNAETQTTNGGGLVVDASDSLEATLIGASRAPRASGAGQAYRRQAQQRRRANPAPSFAPETPAPMTTPASPSADGRQYLAPVDDAPQYVASAPTTHGAGFGPVRGVDPGLPAQAYRGPGTRAITPPPAGGAPLYLGPATR